MATLSTLAELDQALGPERPQFLEFWAESPQKTLCALINGSWGWLVYFSHNQSYSSRNPELEDSEEVVEYLLENGQLEQYPKAWAFPSRRCGLF